MASYDGGNGRKNDTISWIPSFFRGVFGLNDTVDRPQYTTESRQAVANSTVSWIPGPVRRFLGLEGAQPTGASTPSSSLSMPRIPSVSYTTSQSYNAGASSNDLLSQFDTESKAFMAANTAAYTRKPESFELKQEVVPAPQMQPVQLPPMEGFAQPIFYLVRSYLRGMLPPQGLEPFGRDVGKTVGDVTDMYGRVIGFQVQDFTKAIQEFRTPRTTQTGSQIRIEEGKSKHE